MSLDLRPIYVILIARIDGIINVVAIYIFEFSERGKCIFG